MNTGRPCCLKHGVDTCVKLGSAILLPSPADYARSNPRPDPAETVVGASPRRLSARMGKSLTKAERISTESTLSEGGKVGTQRSTDTVAGFQGGVYYGVRLVRRSGRSFKIYVNAMAVTYR